MVVQDPVQFTRNHIMTTLTPWSSHPTVHNCWKHCSHLACRTERKVAAQLLKTGQGSRKKQKQKTSLECYSSPALRKYHPSDAIHHLWTTATIITIPMTVHPTELSHYRPIARTCIPIKCPEKLILNATQQLAVGQASCNNIFQMNGVFLKYCHQIWQ